MKVAIHAYENIYGGLHGIENYAVVEVDDLEEAEAYGVEMSIDVINSYHNIIEEFYESAEADGLEINSPEWDEYIDECIESDIVYNIYPLTTETDKTLEELTDEFYYNEKEFLNIYCGE